MSTARETWKAAERAACEDLNPGKGKRTPLSGMGSKHTPADCINVGRIYCEVKYRATCAVRTLLDETIKKSSSRTKEKIAILALVAKRKPGRMYCVHCSDMEAFAIEYLRNRRVSCGAGNAPIQVCDDLGNSHHLVPLAMGEPASLAFLTRILTSGMVTAANSATRLKAMATQQGDFLKASAIVKAGALWMLYGSFGEIPLDVHYFMSEDDVTEIIKATGRGTLL